MKIDHYSFVPSPEKAGWFICETEADQAELENIAERLNDQQKAKGYLAVCGWLPDGENHKLYLVPDRDPVSVARDFAVGTHGDEHHEVIDELLLVQKENPIVPFFADPAGIKFKFRKPITDEFVRFLEATLSAGMDDQMFNDDGELNVQETGFVHLWWD